MKLLKLMSACCVLLMSHLALAQEPVVGFGEPESHFTDPDPQMNAKKQVALHIMRELLQCNHWSDAGNWLTDRYLQHNPNVGSGLAPVIAFFTATRKPTPTCDKLNTPITAVFVQGDLVTVMYPRTYKHPVTGEPYTSTWYDTWRIVNGKADEHWDPATIAPPAQ